MKKQIIIGTGLAGYMTAKEFRKLNTTDLLTMITQDDGAFYSKPLLSTALAHQRTPDQLPVNTVAEMQQQLDATIHTHWQVVRIDADSSRVIGKDAQGAEQILSYDQLVLAIGAEKVSIPLSGDAIADIVSVNNLEEYRVFRSKLEGKKRIAILGTGLVGCEFANDLQQAGHVVVMMAPDRYPLASFVPEAVGCALEQAFQQAGITLHLSRFVQSVDRFGEQYAITLSDQSLVEADLVFSAVGIKPAVQLAKEAGLAVATGIVVNAQLQTSDPHIFALGDCAEVCGELKMYVAPILHGAKVLAQTLAGKEAALHYPVMPIVIKTSICPIATVPVSKNVEGDWVVEANGVHVRALFYDTKQQLRGFALSGDCAKEKMQWAGKVVKC